MDMLTQVIISFASGGVIIALIAWARDRKKDKVEVSGVEIDNNITLYGAWQKAVMEYGIRYEEIVKAYTDLRMQVNEVLIKCNSLQLEKEELLKINQELRDAITNYEKRIEELEKLIKRQPTDESIIHPS
jgi:chromosome segregation ATPase